MMRQIHPQISKLGALIEYLIVSVSGCFVFTRGFRLVAMDAGESEAKSPMHVDASPSKRLTGIAAAIFLLLFVTSEAVAAVIALRR